MTLHSFKFLNMFIFSFFVPCRMKMYFVFFSNRRLNITQCRVQQQADLFEVTCDVLKSEFFSRSTLQRVRGRRKSSLFGFPACDFFSSASKRTCSWSWCLWTVRARHRRQPLSTDCESTPGAVSMPAWAPVSHILQLGLCHHGAPGPSHTNLAKPNVYLSRGTQLCGSRNSRFFIFYFLVSWWLQDLCTCIFIHLMVLSSTFLMLDPLTGSAVGAHPESHRPERQPSLSNSHKVSL